mgnify:FL=1
MALVKCFGINSVKLNVIFYNIKICFIIRKTLPVKFIIAKLGGINRNFVSVCKNSDAFCMVPVLVGDEYTLNAARLNTDLIKSVLAFFSRYPNINKVIVPR